LLVATGCANSFEKVRDAAASAPQWYEEARTEIVGEGYPELASMPQLSQRELRQSTRSLVTSREDIEDARQLFSTHPRSTESVTTEIEIKARKDELRAKLSVSGPTPTGSDRDLFLTPADLDRFREIFKQAEAR